jgi:hypothetical protein
MGGMSRHAAWVAAAFGLLLGTEAQAQGGPPLIGPFYGMTVEGLVLQRSDPGKTLLVGPDNAIDPFVSFRASELDGAWGGGMRAMVDMRLFGQRVQFSAFAVTAMEADAAKSGMDGAFSSSATYVNGDADVGTGNSDLLHAFKAQHRTNLYGTDTAALIPLGSGGWNGPAFVWGTRSLYFKERLSTVAYDEANDLQGTDNDIDRARIETTNFLYGLQVGLQGMMPVGNGVSVGGSVKGGLLANFISVERKFSSDDNLANTIRDDGDDIGFAQFVEIMPRVSWQIAPGVDLTASGMLLWINGVSEATSYFSKVTDRDARGKIHDNGDVLFWGGTLGVTVKLN